MIPVLYTTLKYNINAFPGFLSEGYQYLFIRLWFRINPFLFGMAFALIKFEYKHSNKVYREKIPFWRLCIEKMKQSRVLKWFCYLGGSALTSFSIFILISDTSCIQNKDTENYLQNEVKYCWNTFGASLYNASIQYVFFTGFVLMLAPTMFGVHDKLRNIMNSHLWHVLEELTFPAYLI